MFYEGKQITVTIDDTVPVDYESFLVYGTTKRYENFFLCSLFEKVFIKQTCNCSYQRSVGTEPLFVFSSFSECMISYISFNKGKTKEKVMDYLAYEIDNNSSVVLGIVPSLKPDDDSDGHA